MEVKCAVCGKSPSQIMEYASVYRSEGYKTPEEYVINNEGTFNKDTGKFYCTSCYIEIGMPLGKA